MKSKFSKLGYGNLDIEIDPTIIKKENGCYIVNWLDGNFL